MRKRTAYKELTPRQKEILQYIASGLSREEIANRLGISPDTVKNHMAAVRYKLGAISTANAVAIGLREGIIT